MAQHPFSGHMKVEMEKLEEKLEESMTVVDQFNLSMKNDRDKREKLLGQKHIPQILCNNGQTWADIAQKMCEVYEMENYAHQEKGKTDSTDIIPEWNKIISSLSTEKTNAEVSDDNASNQSTVDFSPVSLELQGMQNLDQTQLLSHSLAGFVAQLPVEHRARFYSRIINDTTNWVSSIFRMKDCSAQFHDEPIKGIIGIIRLAICAKYPDFFERGFECLYEKPPVIYISEAAPANFKQRIAFSMGLPHSCICVVPCKEPLPGQVHKMDVGKLEELIGDHLASNRQPILVVAYASTPQIAQIDRIGKINDICKDKGIWLHLEGVNLATLCLMNVPTNMMPAKASDSCTLDLSAWFGFVACPCVTLYRKEAAEHASKLGFDQQDYKVRLTCFPLWVVLQAVGIDGMVHRVKTAAEWAKKIITAISKEPAVTVLNKKADVKAEAVTTTEYKGIGDLIGKVISAMVVFEMATPVVIFRYSARRAVREETAQIATFLKVDEPKPEAQRELDEYDDALNLWFLECVNLEYPDIKLEAVKVDNIGLAVKMSPLENFGQLSDELIEKFLVFAEIQLAVMTTTANHRESFRDIVEAQDNLQYINISQWAGVGGVQYIPSDWLDSLTNLSDKAKQEITRINIEIVHQLKKNDGAFTLGKTHDDLPCAKFGLVAQACDLEELLGLVYTTGKEIEESSKFEEKMAEMIRKGIEEANKDLVKEEENRLVQEGVLRQVPLVGSLFNWLSPSPSKNPTNFKGRTFNIASGTMKTTEDTYKHHMQIEEQPLSPSQPQKPFKQALKLPRLSTGSPQSPQGDGSLIQRIESEPGSIPESLPSSSAEAGSGDCSENTSPRSQDSTTSGSSGSTATTSDSNVTSDSRPSTAESREEIRVDLSMDVNEEKPAAPNN